MDMYVTESDDFDPENYQPPEYPFGVTPTVVYNDVDVKTVRVYDLRDYGEGYTFGYNDMSWRIEAVEILKPKSPHVRDYFYRMGDTILLDPQIIQYSFEGDEYDMLNFTQGDTSFTYYFKHRSNETYSKNSPFTKLTPESSLTKVYRNTLTPIEIEYEELIAGHQTELQTPIILDNPIIAVNDTYTTNIDSIVARSSKTGILSNDNVNDPTYFEAIKQTGPTNGKLSLSPDGSFTYTPNKNFVGTDIFTYKLGSKDTLTSSLIITNAATVAITVTRARAQTTIQFIDSGQSLVGTSTNAVVLMDLDSDGDLDAFIASSDSHMVWFNDGAGMFSDSGQILKGGNSYSVDFGDLDDDGDLDVYVGGALGDQIWLNDGAGVFSDSDQRLGLTHSYDVELGDLDDDGDLDAFTANGARKGNKVWLNDGAGIFTDSGQNIGVSTSMGIELGDLDGDGDLDAFVANLDQTNYVWLNDGSGVFSGSGQELGGVKSYGGGLGDLDGDGDLDVYIANYPDPNEVWLNDGSGVFSDSDQSLGNLPSRAMGLGDLDGDGDLDAFVANHGQPNTVWLNDGSGVFSDSGLRLGFDYSQSIGLGDLDGDDDLDVFVANSGPNKVWINGVVPEPEPSPSPSPEPEPSPSPSVSPKPESSGGIPGFNLETIIFGIILGVLVNWYSRR